MLKRSRPGRILLAIVSGAAACIVPGRSNPPGPRDDYVLPAEFDPQQAVWMGARPTESGQPVLDVVVQMVAALSPRVRIELMVPSDEVKADVARRLREQKVDERRVRYWTTHSSPTRWYRDVGAIFLRNGRGDLKAVDFDFNCYGECRTGSPEARKKEGIDREMAALAGVPMIKTPLVSEGGDREVNGRGTLLAIEATEMQRNPGMTRDGIERELLRLLGQKKMIWLKRGVAEDDKAERGPLYADVYPIGCGHIDEMARFVAPDTIALAEATPEERDADPVLRMTYDRLEEAARVLRAATDQDGRPFKIVRMPVPDPLYEDVTIDPKDVEALGTFHGSKPGETIRVLLSASYMNFFISNGVVLEAAYWQPGRPESMRRKDEQARSTLERLFPNRRIVPIHAEPLNHGGGGMHCATQQQPAP